MELWPELSATFESSLLAREGNRRWEVGDRPLAVWASKREKKGGQERGREKERERLGV